MREPNGAIMALNETEASVLQLAVLAAVMPSRPIEAGIGHGKLRLYIGTPTYRC